MSNVLDNNGADEVSVEIRPLLRLLRTRFVASLFMPFGVLGVDEPLFAPGGDSVWGRRNPLGLLRKVP